MKTTKIKPGRKEILRNISGSALCETLPKRLIGRQHYRLCENFIGEEALR